MDRWAVKPSSVGPLSEQASPRQHLLVNDETGLETGVWTLRHHVPNVSDLARVVHCEHQGKIMKR